MANPAAIHKKIRQDLALLMDVACMKLDAISARGTKRDFIDLYMILQERGVSLPDLLRAFSKKYASMHYNLMHVKKSLVYFSDAERDPMPRMIKPLPWRTVKNFFISEGKKV